jgi:hypothetical protein
MHNICTGGCKGVSETPGVCQTNGCPKHEQPLEACDCTDSKHDGRQDEGEAGPRGEDTA